MTRPPYIGQAMHINAEPYQVFLVCGSESMFSMNENRLSFSRLKLLPRLLRDVSKIDMSCNILAGSPPSKHHVLVMQFDEGPQFFIHRGTILHASVDSAHGHAR
eukprot:1158213-Pelagomonas_calceolata.AAC.1